MTYSIQKRCVVAIVGTFICSAFTLPALGAEGLSYGYIEGDYINLDVDEPGDDLLSDDFDNGGGFGIQASFPITEMIFIRGSYSETESDFGFTDDQGLFIPGDTDIDKLTIGVGAALPVSDTADVVLGISYADIDFGEFNLGAGDEGLFDDVSQFFDDLDDDTSDGFLVDASWRAQFAPKWEGSVGARYTDIEDVDGLSFLGNIMYEFSPNLGVNLSVDAGDELMTWGIGLRYSI